MAPAENHFLGPLTLVERSWSVDVYTLPDMNISNINKLNSNKHKNRHMNQYLIIIMRLETKRLQKRSPLQWFEPMTLYSTSIQQATRLGFVFPASQYPVIVVDW